MVSFPLERYLHCPKSTQEIPVSLVLRTNCPESLEKKAISVLRLAKQNKQTKAQVNLHTEALL